MKKLFRFVCFFLVLLSVGACGGSNAALDKIRRNGSLRVGVKVDVLGFGYLNPATGLIEGLEVDLAKLIAEEILGNGEAVELFGVTAQTREPMLENGELDIVIATFTITPEREKRFHFTAPYYHDELGFLVTKSSQFTTISDLDGKTIGVANSGTARDALKVEAEKLGIDLYYKEYASYPEIKAALISGKVDAFSVDKSILQGYKDENTLILEEGFNPQDYGIASHLNNKDLAKYLDNLMVTIEKDGRLTEILTRWGVAAAS